ncbi:lipopolysaccharide biosynthesis protein [Aureibacillus halotolerans]|uniref:O-antigen/teichoic acid export membrane protein n=1 Tax=Aureibacillus halotolerans TaxID=1508390 RepID=A0A4R6U1U0_9BACI|nr:oligosaccharide flippase family protein [Aureibacillus halotolerans]TDQ38643.1 O-antigen/teichoic acid export membrane protein [Aureibacillus halotolerans]
MKPIIGILLRKSFVRNVVLMITGTASAQLVSLVLTPVISRIYGPEAYGLMGVFISIIGILSPIASLTYPIAIVLPKTDNDAIGLIRLSLLISTSIATFVVIQLTLFNQQIAEIFHIEDLASFLYLIPLVIFFAGLYQVVEQWLIRTKQFKVTAKVTFLQSLIVQGSKVGIGFMYPFPSILIVLTAFSQALRAVLMIIFSDKKNLNNHLSNQSSIKDLAKKYKDFPIYRGPQSFLNSVSENIPILMLTSFFGPASVGFYTICRTVLAIPTQLIGKSLGDVFYPRISEAANNGEDLGNLNKKATNILISIGVVPFGLVILFGPGLFEFVFGEEWLIAGKYARWIALWSFSTFILQPSIRALPVLNAQALHLKYTGFSLLIRSCALAFGYYAFSSDLIAIALFGVLSGILNIVLIIVTFRISKKRSDVLVSTKS